ncbi:MAG: TolC family protein [Puniceicoccaceae bacterium]
MIHLRKNIILTGICLSVLTQTWGMEQLSLEDAIQVTLENNFAFRIASIDPEIARDQFTGEEAAFDSEIFASGQVSQSERTLTFDNNVGTSSDTRNWQAGVRKRLIYGTTVTARTNLDRNAGNAADLTSSLSQEADLAISLRQPLMRGFGREVNTAGIERARAGFEASIESYRDTVQAIIAQTEAAYWSVARWQEQLELNKSNLEVAEALLEEARERERVGMVTHIEVLQAEASRAERLEEIIATRRSLGDAYDALLTAMGVLPDVSTQGTDPEHTVESLPESGRDIPEFANLWNMALERDPVLAAQEAVMEQRRWDEVAARSATRPNLDLVLSGAYSGVDKELARDAYESAFNRDGHFWSVGLEFSMPWGMRQEKADLRTASKRLEQEDIRYAELRQSLFREVRATYRNLNAVRQSLEAATLTVQLQEATFDREKSKYEQGLSAIRDLLEEQSALDQARIRLLRSKFNQLSTEIEMARLSGTIFQRHGISPELPQLD